MPDSKRSKKRKRKSVANAGQRRSNKRRKLSKPVKKVRPRKKEKLKIPRRAISPTELDRLLDETDFITSIQDDEVNLSDIFEDSDTSEEPGVTEDELFVDSEIYKSKKKTKKDTHKSESPKVKHEPSIKRDPFLSALMGQSGKPLSPIPSIPRDQSHDTPTNNNIEVKPTKKRSYGQKIDFRPDARYVNPNNNVYVISNRSAFSKALNDVANKLTTSSNEQNKKDSLPKSVIDNLTYDNEDRLDDFNDSLSDLGESSNAKNSKNNKNQDKRLIQHVFDKNDDITDYVESLKKWSKSNIFKFDDGVVESLYNMVRIVTYIDEVRDICNNAGSGKKLPFVLFRILFLEKQINNDKHLKRLSQGKEIIYDIFKKYFKAGLKDNETLRTNYQFEILKKQPSILENIKQSNFIDNLNQKVIDKVTNLYKKASDWVKDYVNTFRMLYLRITELYKLFLHRDTVLYDPIKVKPNADRAPLLGNVLFNEDEDNGYIVKCCRLLNEFVYDQDDCRVHISDDKSKIDQLSLNMNTQPWEDDTIHNSIVNMFSVDLRKPGEIYIDIKDDIKYINANFRRRNKGEGYVLRNELSYALNMNRRKNKKKPITEKEHRSLKSYMLDVAMRTQRYIKMVVKEGSELERKLIDFGIKPFGRVGFDHLEKLLERSSKQRHKEKIETEDTERESTFEELFNGENQVEMSWTELHFTIGKWLLEIKNCKAVDLKKCIETKQLIHKTMTKKEVDDDDSILSDDSIEF